MDGLSWGIGNALKHYLEEWSSFYSHPVLSGVCGALASNAGVGMLLKVGHLRGWKS